MIGDRIKYYRNQAGYTQKQLASKAGIATITLQQYESGKRSPKIEQLVMIANALNITSGSLIYGETPSEFAEWDVATLKKLHSLKKEARDKAIGYVDDLLLIDKYREVD